MNQKLKQQQAVFGSEHVDTWTNIRMCFLVVLESVDRHVCFYVAVRHVEILLHNGGTFECQNLSRGKGGEAEEFGRARR